MRNRSTSRLAEDAESGETGYEYLEPQTEYRGSRGYEGTDHPVC